MYQTTYEKLNYTKTDKLKLIYKEKEGELQFAASFLVVEVGKSIFSYIAKWASNDDQETDHFKVFLNDLSDLINL